MVQTASSYEAKLGAMALVILVCLAGIAIQIRVAAIVASLWTRIRVLQQTVNEHLLKNQDGSIGHLLEKQDGSILREAMTIPSLETFTNLGRKGVAVHLATSFVFASMAAIALSILFWYLGISGRCLSVFSGVLFLIILTIVFSCWSSRIRRNLDLIDSQAIYRAIVAGCRTVNLVASRVDEKAGAAIIMRVVDAMMGNAEFLVFDLSDERPNVYYKLGYAHGIGNHAANILLVAREGTPIHFDVAPLRVHFYRSIEHLESLVAAQLAELKRASQSAPLLSRS